MRRKSIPRDHYLNIVCSEIELRPFPISIVNGRRTWILHLFVKKNMIQHGKSQHANCSLM